MKVRPPSGQGPFQKGERLSAAKLNDVVASIPRVTVGGSAGISGSAINVDNPETIHLRVTNQTGTGPRKYSWQEVYRLSNGTWANGTRTGNSTYDWAVERNDASVSAGSTVYQAERSPDTSEWIFSQGGTGGGGNVNITSGETVLMLLGTYDQYKDCPGVPASPPTLTVDCDEPTTELCVPAYAYAVYSRCGYVWNKIGDTRDFGVWANELNGGTASAFRRFYIPRWGGDVDPVTRLPDPDSACMGVAFLNSGAGSTLSCSCPDWAIEQCLQVTYTIIDRPFPTGNGGYTDCADVFNVFDTGDDEGPYWGRTFTALINQGLSLCASGSDTEGPITFNIEYRDTEPGDCFWGPAVFDPCDPCAEFGRFYIRGEIVGVDERPNCGGTAHFAGYLTIADIRSVVCDCETITLKDLEACQGCDGNIGLPPMVFVDLETIEITCCPDPAPPEGMIAYYMPGVEQTANGTYAFWGDQTASDANMTQSVTARLPSIATVGGFDAFSFVNEALSANDDYISSTANALIDGQPGVTIFSVFQFDSAQATDGGIFGACTGSPHYTTGANLVMIASGGSMYPQMYYRRSVGDSTLAVNSTIAMTNGTLYAVIGRINFVNGSQALNISVNGTQANGTAPSGTPYTFDSGINRHAIAGASLFSITGTPTAGCTLKLLEAGMYGYYLTDTQKTELETYLHWKFGIP